MTLIVLLPPRIDRVVLEQLSVVDLRRSARRRIGDVVLC
jgi:hypothetical protein